MEQAGTRRTTRQIDIGALKIGGDAPVVVQSMCATRTVDIDQTVAQTHQLARAGAGIVRIALDNEKEVPALKEIRAQTRGIVLSVDLQENYRIAGKVGPHVDKIRYNPGHLHHIEKSKSIPAKVRWLVDVAREHNLAIRIGVNCGSVAPAFLEKYPGDQLSALVESTAWHCELMDELGFDRFVVSLKDSDPAKVLEANRRFAARRPEGIIKTRIAFEKLLAQHVGDTIRVSLTLPNERKHEEVTVGHQIIKDVENGRFISVPDFGAGLNIISCPSCSRVENEKFVELAQQVKDVTAYAARHRITIAVMGCRVNGPGETDDADLGLWCGPTTVNLKKKDRKLGNFRYDDVLTRLRNEVDKLIAERSAAANN
jgi:(E)-4-hydroxy-3-methylbut-2-enyl-diphosphate synthase